MFNERGQRITEAKPAQPALILGLNGAPQAGDKFNVMDSEQEAREVANKREQLQREQGLRTSTHLTLDEIGRRIALGDFHEMNIIVKGDVDGSVEALSDSLIKLTTEQIQINVIHKAVGQISESDVMLAAASNAIIVGFQVRPSQSARKLAEQEKIDIRLYSIIYDAIEQIKDAMEGMLSPEIKEVVTGSAEVQKVFKISKVGTIAGCLVREGKVRRTSKVRVIREGIVLSTNVPPLKYDIVVDPKLSFGSGHHETTTLMIERILQTRFDGKSVLDMGCGTAVLAILAYKMGAESVSAIDIDDWAYRNAQTNFEMNGVKNFDLRLGGVDVLPQNQFDYIFANINRNILLEGIPHYVKCMRAGSRLYLSGFYEGDIPVVRGVAEPCGLRYQEDVTKKNEWVSISFEKQ